MRFLPLAISAALGLAHLLPGPDAAAASPPEMVCPALQYPTHEGFPQERDWARVPPVPLHNSTTGEPGRFRTTVQTLYDREYFYVRFFCEDDSIWSTYADRDSPIWEEECVEVFINPVRSPHQYYEINLSPAGVVYDSIIINNRRPERPWDEFIGFPDWNAEGMVTAVKIDGAWNQPGAGRSWTALYAIPHRALLGAPNQPPLPGERWDINFYRIDRPAPDADGESYAWSTTGTTAFHLPWKFGTVRFAPAPDQESGEVHP